LIDELLKNSGDLKSVNLRALCHAANLNKMM